MTPYYSRDGLTLHLGNCLVVMAGMAEIAKRRIDAALDEPKQGKLTL